MSNLEVTLEIATKDQSELADWLAMTALIALGIAVIMKLTS